MRTIAAMLVVFALAMAQSFQVPAQVQAGTPVTIEAEGLEPGAYPIEIEGPDGVRVVTLVTSENSGALDWVPETPGDYRLKLYLSADKKLTAEVEVVEPPPTVQLTEEGLEIGEKSWPLPQADWLEPLVTADGVFLAARGEPLVLEYPLEPKGPVRAFYPASQVVELAPGPEVVFADGTRKKLTALDRTVPFAASWSSLDFLKELNGFWRDNGLGDRLPPEPDGYLPYWAYFAFDPATLTADELTEWGRDLLARGHRPELRWGKGARYWTDPWHRAAEAGNEQIIWALLRYAPIHPDGRAFFKASAARLREEGREAEAVKIEKTLAQASSFTPMITADGSKRVFLSFLLAYLALALIIFARYISSQRRNLAGWGGILGSWSHNPLKRLRHLLLVYATWGERLLALLIFAVLAVSLLLWSLAGQFEQAVERPLLDRATLSSEEALAGWPDSPGLNALRAYQKLATDPVAARKELESADPPLAFAQLMKYRLDGDKKSLYRAYEIESAYVPVQEAMGLGSDAWTEVYRDAGVDRRGTPRLRDLCRVYLWGALAGLAADPISWLRSLGIEDAVWAYGVLVLLALLALFHLLTLLLPRPRGAERSRSWPVRLLELLIPGSNSFGKGWGVVLLVAAAYGAVLLYEGAQITGLATLAAAYLVHLFLWIGEVKN